MPYRNWPPPPDLCLTSAHDLCYDHCQMIESDLHFGPGGNQGPQEPTTSDHLPLGPLPFGASAGPSLIRRRAWALPRFANHFLSIRRGSVTPSRKEHPAYSAKRCRVILNTLPARLTHSGASTNLEVMTQQTRDHRAQARDESVRQDRSSVIAPRLY